MGSSVVSAPAMTQSAVIELARSHGIEVIYSVGGAPQIVLPFESGPQGRLNTAKAWLRASEISRGVLGDEFGGDPAWQILLDVYVHDREHRSVSINSACIASGVPISTAQRWIGMLVSKGWLVRTPDPQDARRAFLHMPTEAVASMESALDTVVDSDRRLGLQRMGAVEAVERAGNVTSG